MSVFRMQLLPSSASYLDINSSVVAEVCFGRSGDRTYLVSLAVRRAWHAGYLSDAYTILSQDPERKKPAFAGHGTAMPPAKSPV